MKLQVGTILLVASAVLAQNETETPAVFFAEGCDLADYYSGLLAGSTDPTQWSREDLENLVRETHRRELPVTGKLSGDDDIYRAIIDLDPGETEKTVHLVYRDIEMEDFPNANPLYWDVERLWPMERGYNRFSPAFTDVHQVKPADSTVLLRKGILSFGMCDTVEFADACVSPANSETAVDTAQDNKIWQPPVNARGEIARALLYMDLRYPLLTLQDCGPFEDAMGYLSQMLQWSADSPPNEMEIRRNNQACSRWQGNRNPFIDYPELGEALHGPPEDIQDGTRTYPTCIADFPTQAPTATPNPCGNFNAGDSPVVIINTDNTDEVIFFNLFELPENMDLFITDRAWDGTALVEGVEKEGTEVMTTPEGGIPEGTFFGYGPSPNLGDQWEVESGEFSLGTESGDNVFLYCVDADDKIRFLSGFSNAGNWSLPGLTAEDYGEAMSALPADLVGAAIVLPHLDNYFYNGSRSEVINLLRADMLNPAAWAGDDENRFGISEDQVESGAKAFTVTIVTALLGVCSVSTFLL